MNAYTQLLTYIKTLGEADIFVNTITKDGGADLDTYKGNVFPILDVFVTGASFPANAVVSYTIELTCVNLRDISKEISTDKFWGQDNEVDNLNETQAVLNRIWLNMVRDFADNNITASEDPTLTPIIYEGENIYDGWTLTMDIDVPNTTISLC
jgi:hypothetical protein